MEIDYNGVSRPWVRIPPSLLKKINIRVDKIKTIYYI